MKIKSIFIAATILLIVSANCHASKKVVERHSFSFSENDDEVVLEIEVSEGQPRTDINIGTKIIEVKKDSVLIAKMESIRLADFNIGESFQFIEQENNLLCIQQSFGDSRYYEESDISFDYTYKVSSTYVEKGERTNETRERTYYFIKYYNVFKKYSCENARISKEIEIQAFRYKRNSILVMIAHSNEMCSLYKIKFMKGNSVAINDDVYFLEKESYDRLCSDTIKKPEYCSISIDTIFSLFSMTPYFLIDGHLRQVPYNLFCNIERYKILNGKFFVQNPFSGTILKHACAYEYDEKDNLKSMAFRCENPDSAGMDYSLEVAKRTGKEIIMKESYDSFERSHETKVTHRDFDKQECDMAGDYFHYPTSNEFIFTEIIRCEKMQEMKGNYSLIFNSKEWKGAK